MAFFYETLPQLIIMTALVLFAFRSNFFPNRNETPTFGQIRSFNFDESKMFLNFKPESGCEHWCILQNPDGSCVIYTRLLGGDEQADEEFQVSHPQFATVKLYYRDRLLVKVWDSNTDHYQENPLDFAAQQDVREFMFKVRRRIHYGCNFVKKPRN